jgi:hypothetical protein
MRPIKTMIKYWMSAEGVSTLLLYHEYIAFVKVVLKSVLDYN